MGDSKHRAERVGIIARLIKTVTVRRHHFIHRYGLLCAVHRNMAHKVRRRLCARIIFHNELIESHRQRSYKHRIPHPQMHLLGRAAAMRDQCSGKYDQKRDMKHKHGRTHI